MLKKLLSIFCCIPLLAHAIEYKPDCLIPNGLCTWLFDQDNKASGAYFAEVEAM